MPFVASANKGMDQRIGLRDDIAYLTFLIDPPVAPFLMLRKVYSLVNLVDETLVVQRRNTLAKVEPE